MIKILEIVSTEIDNIKSYNSEFLIKTLLDLITCTSRLNKVGNFLSKSKDIV